MFLASGIRCECGLPFVKLEVCKGTPVQTEAPWQLTPWDSAQAGHRASKTECFQQWQENRPAQNVTPLLGNTGSNYTVFVARTCREAAALLEAVTGLIRIRLSVRGVARPEELPAKKLRPEELAPIRG